MADGLMDTIFRRLSGYAARILFCAAALAFVMGCGAPFLVPNPPPGGWDDSQRAAPIITETPKAETPKAEPPKAAPPAPERETAVVTDEKAPETGPDFSDAFADGEGADADSFDEFDPELQDVLFTAPRVEPSLRYPPFKMSKRPVRVMVRRGVKDIYVSSTATVQVRTGVINTSFKGRMHIGAVSGGSSVAATVNKAKKELRLPCTLYVDGGGIIKLGEDNYRGSIVITPDPNGGGTPMFVNVLDVEEYLRGVVPLEIGNLKDGDIEAVKAQAVAARTYTLKKMAQRAAQEFDLVNTVSDQVYGGANAEGATSDMALRLTKNLVMVHDEELVNAYYHSTCGGVTANAEDVWGAQSQPYLSSIKDVRPDGGAYCGEGNSFTWEETWGAAQLANIIKKHSADGRLDPQFKGNTLRGIEVSERFECGRVKKLRVVSNSGEFFAGGDKTRFLLRRDIRGNPILRSALITSVNMSGAEVVIAGRGHGHGIGMCQVGAIARARAGQAFENILGAYYTGVSIRTVTDK